MENRQRVHRIHAHERPYFHTYPGTFAGRFRRDEELWKIGNGATHFKNLCSKDK